MIRRSQHPVLSIKRFLLSFLFVIVLLPDLNAQNYVFEYDVDFLLQKRRYFWLRVNYTTQNDNSEQILSDFTLEKETGHRHTHTVRGRIEIPATKGPIKEISAYTRRKNLGPVGAGTTLYPQLYFSQNNATEFDKPPSSLNWGAFDPPDRQSYTTVRTFRMYPELKIQNLPASTNLTFDDRILISATSGFPRSVYRWQYSTNSGNSWRAVPDNVISPIDPGKLHISASDLMNESEFLTLLGNNTNIQFRIYNPVIEYNIVQASLRLASPHIVNHSFEQESCRNSGDATITLTFDRPLKPGEKLQIFVDNLVSQETSDVVPDATNSYTIHGLEAGRREISLLGSYNTYQTYTGDPNHSAEVNIPVRTQLQHSFIKKDISCHEGGDGEITINAKGGTGEYTAHLYEYGDSSPLKSIQFTAASPGVFTRLPAGSYQVRVVDGNGCIAQAQDGTELIHDIELNQPPVPVSAIVEYIRNPLSNGSSDGEVSIRISGGTQLINGYTVTCTRAGGGTFPAEALVKDGNDYLCTISNLPEGNYLVRIEDANYPGLDNQDKDPPCGCLFTVDFQLRQPEKIEVSINEKNPVSCNEGSDGALVASGLGGIQRTDGMPYVYTWYDVSSGQPVAIDQPNDSTLSGIPAGSYQVRITDANDIEALSGIFTINQPDPLQVSVETKDIGCFDGEDGHITLSAEGGSGEYSASIFKDGSSTALNTIEFSGTGQGIFPRLTAGEYIVRVSDSNGCVEKEADGSEMIHFIELTQPPVPVSGEIEFLKNPLAFGASDGEAQFRISGGTQIADGYTVTCTRTDGKTFAITGLVKDGDEFICTVSNLPDGEYALRIEDANYPSLEDQDKNPPCGCLFIIDFELREPPKLEVSIEEVDPISCNDDRDGRLIAHAVGGIIHNNGMPYTYTWYDATSGQPTEIVQQNDSILAGIPTGSYQVRIIDANQVETLSEIYFLNQPDSLRIIFETVDAGCAGGSGNVKAVVTGGTAPYSYQWNKEGETGAEIAAITAGDYIVWITDQRGCTLSATVEVTAPGGLKIDTLITHPSCFNGSDGAIELKLTGATPPYTVRWKDNNSTELTRKNLSTGVYEIIVSDVNDCETAYSFTLHDPEDITVELDDDFTLCKDQSRLVTARSNQEEVTYEWYRDGEKLAFNTAEIIVDSEGSYKVVATNRNGCAATDEIVVKMGRDTFNVDFTVPTTILPATEIHAVNIGTIAADKIVWTLPEEATPINLTDTEAVFSIDRKGTYTISMEGFKGDCSTVLTRTIIVAREGEVELPDDKNPLIRQFLVTPNPTEGAFKVHIELNRKEDFTMILYSPAGVQMDRKDVKETQSTVFEYDIRGELSGAFMLHLITKSDKAAIKIVKEAKK